MRAAASPGARPAGRWLALLATVGAAVAAPRPAAADAPAPLPVRENFPPLEQAAALGAAASGIVLLLAGPRLLSAPLPSMGPPAPRSLDARLSRWFYRPGGGRFLGGAPDVLGASLLPALPAVVYGLPLLAPGLISPDAADGPWNPGHRLLAYAEAIGWTYLLTGVIKYAVGRPRPYTELANNHPELRHRPGEDNLSFFSGHASGMFAAGAFVTEDLSRHLQRTWLVDSTPATRFWLGTAVPYTVGYGLPALVGLSRIIDQQHWPSDVVMGTVVGSLVAHLVYSVHFDGQGQPRRRRPPGNPVTANRVSSNLVAAPVVSVDPHGVASFQLSVAAPL
jgi:membrane-associated phospholipid phosphatase